jgi:hypothetical protein
MSLVDDVRRPLDPRMLRRIAYGLAVVGVALGAMAALNDDPVWTILALAAPAPALGLALTAPEHFEVRGRGRGTPGFNPVIGAGAFVLVVGALRQHLLGYEAIGVAALAGGVLGLALAALAPSRGKLESPLQFFVVLAIIGAVYAGGGAALADVRFDASPGQVFEVAVANKYVSHGRSTTYELVLPPWGPQRAGRSVSVPRSIYDAVEIGGPVCVTLRPGALWAPWFTVSPCRLLARPA